MRPSTFEINRFARFCVFSLLVGCDGGMTDPPPVQVPPTATDITVRTLSVVDAGNTGTSADLQVVFRPATGNASVQEYRVFIDEAGTPIPDVATALTFGPDRYHVVATGTDTLRLDGLTAPGGPTVREEVQYSVWVLSVGRTAELPGAVSTPALVTLQNESTVRTFAPRIIGGTGGIAIGPDGVVYMADFVGSVYRVEPDGTQSLFSQGHSTPSGNVVRQDGTVLQANFGDGTIDAVAQDGRLTRVASGLQGPVGLTEAANGELFVVNCNANSVSRIEESGTVSTFSQSSLFQCPNSIVADGAGKLYVVNFNDGRVLVVDSDGSVSIVAAVPGGGNGHLVLRDGSLWVTAKAARQIYRVELDGTVELVAGSGAYGALDGPARAATLARPNGIVLSPDGRFLYWNDHLGDAQNNYAAGPSVLRRLEFPR